MSSRFFTSKSEPPIVVAPVKDPSQMSDEERARVRLAAQVESQTAVAMRDRLITELTTSTRWIQASLLLISGGAAVAVLQSPSIPPSARLWGGGSFVIGIVLSLLGAYAGVRLTQDAPVRAAQIGAYWLSVTFDLNRSEATEREWQQYGRDLARKSRRNQLIGWSSLAAFVFGCVVVGVKLG